MNLLVLLSACALAAAPKPIAKLGTPVKPVTAKLGDFFGKPPVQGAPQQPLAPAPLPAAEFSGPWSDAKTDEKTSLLAKLFDGFSTPDVVGEPGPGITPLHVSGVQRLADRIGAPLFMYGSRQSGTSVHTGKPWRPSSDLDLGVVGGAEELFHAYGAPWRHVPDILHPPMTLASSLGEAVERGGLVVLPRPGRRVEEQSAVSDLQMKFEDWATRNQLTRLAETKRGDAETFSFALIGDSEPGRFWWSRALFNKPGIFRKILSAANESSADFILQLGDMVSRGTPGRFRRFLEELGAAGLLKPYLTVIGNHDRRKPHGLTDSHLYRALFGGTNYWFERGGYRIIIVDSSAGQVTKGQLEWLERSLNTPRRKIVLTHIPPASLPWTTAGLGGFKKGAEAFMDLMARAKVDRVYMGHIHGYGEHDDRGVKYVLTGGGGSALFPGAKVDRREHHWLTVTAGPGGVTETLHRP